MGGDVGINGFGYRVSGAMRLSRSSHRKRDPAIPNQVGARRPVPPTYVDPRKLKRSPLRYYPWSAGPVPSSRTPRTTSTSGSVARSASSTAPPPTVRRYTAWVVVAKPHHPSVPGARSGGRRSVVTLRLLLLLRRLRERGREGGRGGGS